MTDFFNKKDRNYGLNGTVPCSDPKCKANTVRLISRKVCRNNCKYFNYKRNPKKRSCEMNYK